jgi:polar amino acid transport system permease protein
MDLDYTISILGFILQGTGVTLKVYVITLVFSIPLGILCALGKLSSFKPLNWFLGAYTWLFRGEPAISGFDWLFTPIHTSSQPFSQTWVRSSISFYGYFNLHMDRSPGFGSTACN